MGYPMTYGRVVARNQLTGGYTHDAGQPPPLPRPSQGRNQWWGEVAADTLDGILLSALKAKDWARELARATSAGATYDFYEKHPGRPLEAREFDVVSAFLNQVAAHALWHKERAIAGDLRRLEADQRDGRHLDWYAEKAGVTPGQAKAVLDAFFDGYF